MLRIIRVKYLSGDLISVAKDNTVDGINDINSKVSEVKFKNMVIPDVLVKFILLVDINFGISFLTLKAKLAFIKLR